MLNKYNGHLNRSFSQLGRISDPHFSNDNINIVDCSLSCANAIGSSDAEADV